MFYIIDKMYLRPDQNGFADRIWPAAVVWKPLV